MDTFAVPFLWILEVLLIETYEVSWGAFFPTNAAAAGLRTFFPLTEAESRRMCHVVLGIGGRERPLGHRLGPSAEI